MKIILLLTSVLIISYSYSQTVIEMTHPGDANIILLEVDDINDADIAIYKTDDKELYQKWDCMWKYKTWGFSNFSVYVTKDNEDPLMLDEETGLKLVFHGKVYYTEDPEERGYKTEGFMLEGVFRKFANNSETDKDKEK
ncbi:MAG: hypothetical protein ABIJ97_01020, partial [Bacteroidota bacterium]